MNLLPLLLAGCFKLPGDMHPMDTTVVPFDNPYVTTDDVVIQGFETDLPCPSNCGEEGPPARFYMVYREGATEGAPVAIVLHSGAFDYVMERSESGSLDGPHYHADSRLEPDFSTAKVWETLGLQIEDIDPSEHNLGTMPAALADQLKLDHGVRLTEVNADSPAGKAGLEVDDIILGVNGKQVGNMLQLRDAITAHKQGDEVTLKLIQKGKQVEKKVTLAARPALPQIVLPAGVFQGGGIQIVPNGIQRLQRFGLGENGFKMRDNDGSVEVSGEVEDREVTVWDLSNKIIYEGPWVTPQDKAAPPQKMRRRIERVEKTFALRLQRQPFALPQRVPNPAPRPQVRPKVEEDPRPKEKDGEPEE